MEAGAEVTPRRGPAHSPEPPPLQVPQVSRGVVAQVNEVFGEVHGALELRRVDEGAEGEEVLVSGATVDDGHHSVLQRTPQLLRDVVVAKGVFKREVKEVRRSQPPVAICVHVIPPA